MSHANSVTRFGKNSTTLWQKKLNVFGYFSESLFSIWQNFEPTLVTLPFVCYSADLYYKKLPNIYKSSSHLVTLPAKKSNKKLR